VFEHLGGSADLHERSVVHDGDPLAHLTHDLDIVRNHDQRKSMSAAQIGDQIEDLSLNRDVER